VFNDGLPAPVVTVTGAEPANEFFVRQTAIERGENPIRELVLPTGGLYTLQVSTADVAQGMVEEPVGSPEWHWLVALTTQPSISATAATDAGPDETLVGGFNRVLDNTWQLIGTSPTDLLSADVMRVSAAHEPALVVFDSNLNFVVEVSGWRAGEVLALDIPGDEAFVVLDHVRAAGVAGDESAALQLGRVDDLTPPDEITVENTGHGDQSLFRFEASPGELLTIDVATDTAESLPRARLLTAEQPRLITQRAGQGLTRLQWFDESGGSRLLSVENALEGIELSLMHTISVAATTVSVAPALDPAGSGAAMVAVDASANAAPAWFAIPLANTAPGMVELAFAGGGNLAYDVTLWHQDTLVDELGTWSSGNGGSATAVIGLPSAGFVLGRIDVASGSGTIDVDATWGALSSVSGGDSCPTAAEGMTGPGTIAFELPLAEATNRISTTVNNSCHPDGTRVDGPDTFLTITVPDGATLEAHASGTGLGADPALAVVDLVDDDCALIGEAGAWTCAATSVHSDPWTPIPSAHVVWTNDSGAEQTVYLVVDNAIDGPGPYTETDLNILTLNVQ